MSPHRGPAALSRRAAARDREDAVVERLRMLAPHLDPEPDPEARAAVRARLVAMAAVRTPPAPASPLRRRAAALGAAGSAPSAWRARLTAGLTGAALGITALAGLVALSTTAGPGDVLYDVKRGTERAQLALAGDGDRGETLLDLASTRLDEVGALVRGGVSALPAAPSASGSAVLLAAGSGSELVLATLRTMDEQTREGAASVVGTAVSGHDAAPLDRLASWTRGQTDELTSLLPAMPSAAEDAVNGSLRLLSDIDARAGAVRIALGCAGGPSTDGSDRLGPVPATCPATPPGAGSEDDGSGPDADSATSPGSGPATPARPSPARPTAGDPAPATPPPSDAGGEPEDDDGGPAPVLPPPAPRPTGMPEPPPTPMIPPPPALRLDVDLALPQPSASACLPLPLGAC